MIEIIIQFFRFVFICYLCYIAFIILKAAFDLVVFVIEYYCFGKKSVHTSRKSKTKEKETEIWYNDWD